MLVHHSFDPRFITMMDKLKKQYGEEMFNLEGIGEQALDINRYSKTFFGDDRCSADKTIDDNSNVDDTSVVTWEREGSKPIYKLNSLYMMWKASMNKYGIKRANKLLEAEISGALRIHDLHKWCFPYSYYQETPIIIRINKGPSQLITLKQLFDYYKEGAIKTEEKEFICNHDFKKPLDFGKKVPFEGTRNTIYFKEKDILNTTPLIHHCIEVLDGDGSWVDIECILRHKRDKDFIAYQTSSGDLSVVTEDHPVILADGSEIPAGLIEKGMGVKMAVPYSNDREEYIAVPASMAYLIGFIIGDGNIERHAFYQRSKDLTDDKLSIHMSKMESSVMIYQKDIEKSKIFQCVKELLPEDSYTVTAENRIRVCSRRLKYILSTFMHMDYTNNSLTKTLPVNILNWTENSKIGFILGLTDSEGTVHENGLIDIRMTALSVITGLKDVLNSIDIVSQTRIAECKHNILFGISFHIPREKASCYSYLSEKYKDSLYDPEQDKYVRDNKISKVFRLSSIKGQKVVDEYVYDISTSSHTFRCNGMTQHNCYAGSLTPLVQDGMPFYNKIKIGAVQHFDSFIDLSLQYICFMSNHIAGAAALPNFFVYTDYFIRKDDGEEWYEDDKVVARVRQRFQSFIYSVNFNWRSNQSPFTNLSVFDVHWLHALFDDHVNPDFSKPDFDNIMRMQRIFVEEMVRNLKDNPFTFPVMTAAMLYDEEKGVIPDEDFFDWASGISESTGLFNFYIDTDTASLSSCCRLRNNLAEASREYTNSFGVGGLDVGCYDGDTELLTDNGWVFFKDLEKETRVLTLNPETKQLEYQLPTKYFEADYDGEMHEYKTRGIDLLVTPNHNMLVESKKTGKLSLKRSDELTQAYHLYKGGGEPTYYADSSQSSLTHIIIGDSKFEEKAFYTFLGLYIGDGGTYQNEQTAKEHGYEIPIYAGKSELKENIHSKIKTLGLPVKEYKNRDAVKFVVYSKDLWEYLHKLGVCKEKYIPENILQSHRDCLEALFNGLMLTDGTSHSSIANEELNSPNSKNTVYYTSSKRLANSVQELFILLGYSSRLSKRGPRIANIRGREIQSGECYEVFLHKAKTFSKPSLRRNIVNYKGKIYCVEVPNHVLVVRRNGYVTYCGNSHRVITLNLPQLSHLSEDWDEFLKLLEYRVHMVHDILDVHRESMQTLIDSGRLPLYKYNFMFLQKQFSTVGFIGMYEALEIMGFDIIDKKGYDKGHQILEIINNMNEKRTQATGHLYNVEQIPGESAAYNFARKDSHLFEDAKYELYSNQYIPLTKEVDVGERIIAQGRFDKSVGGGSILHININEEIDKKQIKKLIKFVAKKGVVYFAINLSLSRCTSCGKVYVGQLEKSPCHNAEVDKFLRVVGYLTPVKTWSAPRREEYKERQMYGSDVF